MCRCFTALFRWLCGRRRSKRERDQPERIEDRTIRQSLLGDEGGPGSDLTPKQRRGTPEELQAVRPARSASRGGAGAAAAGPAAAAIPPSPMPFDAVAAEQQERPLLLPAQRRSDTQQQQHKQQLEPRQDPPEAGGTAAEPPGGARPAQDVPAQQRPGEAPAARLSRGGLNAVSEAASDAPRSVVVMRHGHRQDEADLTWTHGATRPWDPPLSTKGRTQAREAAGGVCGLQVDLVVTSPFKRCLQTSAELVAELGLPQGSWLVDWGLSEVCDPRILLHGRPDCEHMAKGRPIDSWMWGGATLAEALDMFSESCAEQLPSLRVRPEPREGSRPPPFPEALEGGLKRYCRAVQQLVWSYPGKNLLVVTHGECVRAVVNMVEPRAEVFEVRHVGYVLLRYAGPDDDSEAGGKGWSLASSQAGENGVFWITDD